MPETQGSSFQAKRVIFDSNKASWETQYRDQEGNWYYSTRVERRENNFYLILGNRNCPHHSNQICQCDRTRLDWLDNCPIR